MDHLLRTLAAVPPDSRVLAVGEAPPDATVALRDLGFDVEVASGDLQSVEADRFEWVAAWFRSLDTARGTFDEIARVLAPGAWAWVSVGTTDAAPEALTDLASGAGLVLAERAVEVDSGEIRTIRGIYRRVDATTTK